MGVQARDTEATEAVVEEIAARYHFQLTSACIGRLCVAKHSNFREQMIDVVLVVEEVTLFVVTLHGHQCSNCCNVALELRPPESNEFVQAVTVNICPRAARSWEQDVSD